MSDALAESFRGRGIAVQTATRVERLERAERGAVVHYRSCDQPERLDVDAVLLGVGWPGNADLIGARNVGIETDLGYVKVDDALRSNLPHVLAAGDGDVNGISMLVPSARLEGRIAAENAVLGTRRRFTHELVPSGSYENLVRPVIDDHPTGSAN